MCEICSKLTIKILERRQRVSIVNFKQVNTSWEVTTINLVTNITNALNALG